MAGLLGDFEDPRTQGLLALGLGLLNSRGSFGQGLGQAGTQAMQTMQDAHKLQMAQKLQGAQLEDIQQQVLLRNQQLAMAKQKQDMLDRLLNGGGPPADAAPAGLPSMMTGSGLRTPEQNSQVQSAIGAAAAPSAAPGSNLSRMNEDQIIAAIGAGLPEKAYDAWKFAKVGEQMQPGYQRLPNGKMVYNPDPTKGITLGPDGSVQAMPGATAAQAAIAAATTNATERAKNQNALVPPTYTRGGAPIPMTLDQLIQQMSGTAPVIQPGAPTAPMAAPGGASAPFAATAVAPGAAAPARPAVGGFGGGGRGGFDTAAQSAAEKLAAEQAVHAATDPLVKFNTDRIATAHANVQKTYEQLQDTVRNEAELQNRNAQLLPMLKKIQTGGFAPEARIALANAMQTSNLVPESLKGKFAEWVTNGDPSTGKVIENQLASAAIKTMLDTLDKEGKPNRAIFQALQDAQESVKSGNATLEKVFGLQRQLYDFHLGQVKTIGDAMEAPNYNPIKLQSQIPKIRDAALKAAEPTAQAAPSMRWNPTTGKLEKVQ